LAGIPAPLREKPKKDSRLQETRKGIKISRFQVYKISRMKIARI
jgi:hypothetical protein